MGQHNLEIMLENSWAIPEQMYARLKNMTLVLMVKYGLTLPS